MTIVAGFCFSEGILFCADSLHAGYAHTTHEPKLFRLDCAVGSFIFGYAGNPSFARAAILTCHRRLNAADAQADAVEILERTVDKEYRRLVLSTPQYAGDATYSYRLLIGIRQWNGGMAMFSTEGPALSVCSEYCCLGVGEVLANYLTQSFYAPGMSLEQITNIATYMMGRVKAFVPGCGGLTNIHVLLADGRVTRVTQWDVTSHEHRSDHFDEMVARLFLMTSDRGISDEEFAKRVDQLNHEVRLRREHTQDRFWDEMLRQIAASPSPEGQPKPQSTINDLPLPQPSLESPGETDES